MHALLKEKKAQDQGSSAAREARNEVPPPVPGRARGQRWARLSKQTHGGDPLVGPHCGDPMRIITYMGQAAVSEENLTRLGLWPAHSRSPPNPLPQGRSERGRASGCARVVARRIPGRSAPRLPAAPPPVQARVLT